MSGSIERVRAKLARAGELERELTSATSNWFESNPVGLEGETDADGWFVMRFRLLEPPPIRMGLLLGDWLNNLRGALDHLVWQLVIANGQKPSWRNSYPIVEHREKWGERRSRDLAGVAPEATHLIEEDQPFNALEPRKEPLWVLNHLNNVSKHRIIPPVVVSAFEWEPTFHLAEEVPQDARAEHELRISRGPLRDGQVLGRVRLSPPIEITHLSFGEDATNAVSIGFEDEHLTGRFPDLTSCVQGVVDQFEGFVGP